MKKILLITLILCLFLPIFSFSVSATDYLETFEDMPLGQPTNNSFMDFYSPDKLFDITAGGYGGGNCLRYSGGLVGQAHFFNTTNDKTLNKWSSWVKLPPYNDFVNMFKFRKDGDASKYACGVKIQVVSSGSHMYFKDAYDDSLIIDLSNTYNEVWVRINYTGSGTNCLFTIEDTSGNFLVEYTLENADYGFFECDRYAIKHLSGSLGIRQYQFDNIILDMGAIEPPEIEGTIRINVFDDETGVSLDLVSHSFVGPFPLSYDHARCYLLSDLWAGDYLVDLTGMMGSNPIDLDVEFSPGSFHWITIAYPHGNVNGVGTYWQNYTIYNAFHIGSVFNVNLRSGDYSEDIGWSNCVGIGFSFCGFPSIPLGEPWLCTDKNIYSFGEQILLRYRIPIYQELHDCPFVDGDAYEIWIYNEEDLGLFGFTDGGASASRPDVIQYDHIDATQGGQWQSDVWTAPEPTGGNDFYTIYIGHAGGGSFGTDYNLVSIGFTVINGSFSPDGEITGITPNPAFIGQIINISWTANNNGQLTYRNILKPGDTEQILTEFQRFTGTESIEKQFFDFGGYEIKLYVDGQAGLELQQPTRILYINTTNKTIGAFGYGVEYLMVNPYRAIGGYDNMQIIYNTFNETTPFIIYDARGQRTSHSLLRFNGSGTIDFDIPVRSAIGEWEIFMYGNETLNTSFFVVADENNWVEFQKNSFYRDESFSVKLKHDRKIELEFLKNGVALGQNWFLQADENTYGFFTVPPNLIVPSPGEWTINMYEVNNLVRRELLASDTCIVITQDVPSPASSGGFQSILTIVGNFGDFFGGGSFGLAILSLIFIVVLIVLLSDRKMKNDNIFLVATIAVLVCAFIGWLPVWIAVVAIILAGFTFGGLTTKKLGLGK